MTFYIVRHADKENGDFYNPLLRHHDQPISEKGHEQAQKLCAFFANKGLSKIYVSAYQRTRQAIAPVARHFNLVPILDERLNEIDNGLFDGATEEEIQQRFPAEWQVFCERKADFRFPEGETGEEARDRIVAFLKEKREAHGNENTVIVSHEGLIRILMCHITGNPVYNRWNFYVDFCGITELTYQADYETWKLIRFNQSCL
jgi:broad specificity phosphatase PhoE